MPSVVYALVSSESSFGDGMIVSCSVTDNSCGLESDGESAGDVEVDNIGSDTIGSRRGGRRGSACVTEVDSSCCLESESAGGDVEVGNTGSDTIRSCGGSSCVREADTPCGDSWSVSGFGLNKYSNRESKKLAGNPEIESRFFCLSHERSKCFLQFCPISSHFSQNSCLCSSSLPEPYL